MSSGDQRQLVLIVKLMVIGLRAVCLVILTGGLAFALTSGKLSSGVLGATAGSGVVGYAVVLMGPIKEFLLQK